MAQLTALSSLYALMRADLPGCDANLMLPALQDTVRLFCERTDAWREDLDPIRISEYQQDYKLTMPSGYNAQFHRIKSVKINGVEYGAAAYDLWEENTLRFAHGYSPHDQDAQLLVCAAAGSADVATWKAVGNGSATFAPDSSTYLASGLDFSSCADMHDVASVTQTGIRAAMDSNQVFVRWSAATADRFLVWVASGTIGYLTAGTAGTNIAGPSYMNGLTGSASAPAGRIELEMVFRTDTAVDTLPDWFLDRWAHTLVAGAIAWLANQPKKAWTNADAYLRRKKEYENGVAIAMSETERKYKDAPQVLRF